MRTVEVTSLEKLQEIRAVAGKAATRGLDDAVVERFAVPGSTLEQAIDEALLAHRALRREYPRESALDEPAQIEAIQTLATPSARRMFGAYGTHPGSSLTVQ